MIYIFFFVFLICPTIYAESGRLPIVIGRNDRVVIKGSYADGSREIILTEPRGEMRTIEWTGVKNSTISDIGDVIIYLKNCRDIWIVNCTKSRRRSCDQQRV